MTYYNPRPRIGQPLKGGPHHFQAPPEWTVDVTIADDQQAIDPHITWRVVRIKEEVSGWHVTVAPFRR